MTSTDDQGLSSTTTTALRRQLDARVASRLPARVVVRNSGGKAEIRWAQARAARVKVTIETPEGVVVRTVSSAPLQAGEQS